MATKQQALEQIDKDLRSLLNFCEENHLANAEMAKIFMPLTSAMKKNKLLRLCRYIIVTVLLIGVFYYLVKDSETISWNLSAIGRIIMIKLLPFWNWTYLKNNKCLVENVFQAPNPDATMPNFDCALCEAIDKISVESQVDPSHFNRHYMDLHRPVIVVDSLNDWPIFNNFNALPFDPAYLNSVPCKLSTNLNARRMSVRSILEQLDDFAEYFAHFQNCEMAAVKSFRMLTPRLSFIPAEVSPVKYNWLLMNKNYNVTSFKRINLQEPLALVGQIRGGNFYKLTPRGECQLECPIVNVELAKGEVLVLTSLWDLEYKPLAQGSNAAVILEMR